MHRNHRVFNDIGCSTLHRCVNSRAFGILALHCISSINIGQVQSTTEYRFHITLFAG